ncbi:MAG TPA: prepilin peptidase [Anaerolineales bacterium]|nr:prepilin peptidase [Anaerolineales bacterium]
MYLVLLVLCIGLAWFDFKTARIPNGATLPLLLAGLWLNFPGRPETWLASALLLLGWQQRMLGGGDAKLWLALLWLAPVMIPNPAVVLGAVWVATGALQLAWRAGRRLRVLGIRRPGAWRALPFVAWLVMVS